MATQLLILPDAALTIRYRQPYISQSLNAKFQSIVAPGVYAGLDITPSALDLTIALSVGSASVTSSQDSQYQVSVQITGVQALNLSSLAGATAAIVIEASYDFPTTTTAEIRAYNLSIAEVIPAYACVLGEVDVPGAGVVPANAIRLTGRTMPWNSRDRAAVPFVSAVKNGNFMMGDGPSATTPAFWYTQGAGGSFALNAAIGPSGYGQSVVATAASGANNASLVQYVGVLLTPDRDRVRLRVAYKPTSLAPSTGTPALKLLLVEPGTGAAIGTLEVPLTATSTTAFTQYDELYELSTLYTIPAAGILVSNAVVDFNGATYSIAGAAFSVADVQIDVEASSGAAQTLSDNAGEQRISTLTLVDPTAMYGDGKRVKLIYDATLDTVTLSSPAPFTLVIPALLVTGTLSAAEISAPTVRATFVDSLTSGTTTLNVGTVTQTGLLIGRIGASLQILGTPATITTLGTLELYGNAVQIASAGVVTTVGGYLDVANRVAIELPSDTVGLYIQASPSQSSALQEWRNSTGTPLARITATGNLTVASSIDRETAGSLYIGGTTANYIEMPVGVRITRDLSLGTPALVLKRATSSTAADLLDLVDENDALLMRIGSAGGVYAPRISTASVGATLDIAHVYAADVYIQRPLRIKDTTPSATSIPLTISAGDPAQTGNLTEWKNSTETSTLAYVGASGGVFAGQFDRSSSGTLEIAQNTATLVRINRPTSIYGQGALNTTLFVKGVPSQLANLTAWQDSNSNVVATLSVTGELSLNLTADDVALTITASTGSSGQTENLTEWLDSGGTVLSYVDAVGEYVFKGAKTVGISVHSQPSLATPVLTGSGASASLIFNYIYSGGTIAAPLSRVAATTSATTVTAVYGAYITIPKDAYISSISIIGTLYPVTGVTSGVSVHLKASRINEISGTLITSNANILASPDIFATTVGGSAVDFKATIDKDPALPAVPAASGSFFVIGVTFTLTCGSGTATPQLDFKSMLVTYDMT